MLFKLLGFIFTIIVFIGLKIWDLLKFIWKITEYWKTGLYIIGSIIGFMVVVLGWAYLVEVQAEYFNVYAGAVLMVNSIILIISTLVGILIYNSRYYVSRFFTDNWREAKHIVDNIMLDTRGD